MDAGDLIVLQKAVFDGYIKNVWQTLGMFLVAIGWVVTSDKARTFLEGQRFVRLVCISAAFSILVIHICVLFGSYDKSERLYIHIKNTKIWVDSNVDAQPDPTKTEGKKNAAAQPNQTNLEMSFLDLYRIRLGYPIVSGLLATILVLCFVVMVLKIGAKKNSGISNKAIDEHVHLI